MSEKHSPLEQFKIEPIMPIHFGGYDVSITNSTLFMLVAIASVTLFLMLGMRKQALIPGRWQSLSELSYEFVAGMLKENVGPEGRKFFPFIFTLFMFILFCNIIGMTPYTFTVTSHLAVTFTLAMMVFLMVVVVGIVRHGFHFLHLFIPAGLPGWLKPIIFVIEIVSFMVRPVSLSLRLAVSMIAGHILLKVIAGFVIGLGSIFFIFGGLPLGFIVLLIGLEIFVAALQAYIFAMLTTIYLNDAINLH